MSRTGLLRRGVLGVVLGIPIIAYVAFIAVYGVNAPYLDDFNKMPIVHDLFTGHLTFGELWQQQNEHRLFTTLVLVELPLALLTRYNLVANLIAGAVLLMISAFFLVAAQVRAGASLWAGVPIVALLFSLVQYVNALFPAESWWLGLVLVIATLCCLERSDDRLLFHWVALGLAVLASFSELQGLFVWIAAIPYFLAANVRLWQRATWTGAALLCVMLFFLGFQASPDRAASAHLSTLFVPYVFVELGAVFTGPVPDGGWTVILGFLGLLITAFGAFGIWSVWPNDWRAPALRLPFALCIFGLLNVGATAAGREAFGISWASSSRYTTATLTLVVGIYMLLEREFAMKATLRKGLVLGAFCVLVAVQFVSSAVVGWPSGAAWAHDRRQGGDVFVNYRMAGDDVIQRYLYCCPDLVRAYASDLEQDGVSMFSGPRADYDRFVGITPIGASADGLPVPAPISDRIARDDLARRAWATLAATYASDDTLRATFGASGTSPSLLVLHWAALDGASDPRTGIFLQPFADLYREFDVSVRNADSTTSDDGNEIAGGADWAAARPFSFDPSTGELSVPPATGVSGSVYASSPAFVVVPGESYRLTARIDAKSLQRGRVCEYPAALPSGVGLGMECAAPGSRKNAQLLVTVPQGTYALRWAAVISGAQVGSAPVTISKIRVDDVAPLTAAASPISHAGLHRAAGRPRWYLPSGVSLDTQNRIVISGSGAPTGKVYSGSEALAVLPGRTYAFFANVDARAASVKPPCFYLAEVPSGLGAGMTCARLGSAGHYRNSIQIPGNVWLVQWVAFTNGTTITAGRSVTFGNIGIELSR